MPPTPECPQPGITRKRAWRARGRVTGFAVATRRTPRCVRSLIADSAFFPGGGRRASASAVAEAAGSSPSAGSPGCDGGRHT